MFQSKKYSIYCNDCIKQMQQLIEDGVKVDLVLTDPPYGTTGHNWDSIIPLEDMWNCLKELRYDTTPIVLFGFEPFSSNLRMSNIQEYKYDWIWDKKMPGNIGIAKYQPLRYHELISVFYKKFGKYHPQMMPRSEGGAKRIKYKPTMNTGDNAMGGGKYKKNMKTKQWNDLKYPSSILDVCSKVVSTSHEKVPHPTQKPVKLLEYLLRTYTDEGDVVLDFTMGSGSTGVACMNLNRKFIGIELEKEYFDIAEKRIAEASHEKQTRLI